MLSKNLKDFLRHCVLILGIYIVPNPLFLLPILVIALFKFYSYNKKVDVLIVGVYAFSCKGESVFYAFMVAFFLLTLFDKRKIRYNQDSILLKKWFKFMIVYSGLIYLLNIFNTSSCLSFPFFLITFFSPFLIVFYILKEKFTKEEINKFSMQLLQFSVAQSIISFVLQAMPLGLVNVLNSPTLGDGVKGTFISSDVLSGTILISIIPFLVKTVRNNSYFKDFIFIVIFVWFVFISFLNDAKGQYYSFLIATIIFFLFFLFGGGIRMSKKVLFVNFLILLLVLFWTQLKIQKEEILKSEIEYISGTSNNKIVNYQNTFSTNTRPMFNYYIGTGAGTNGSRAANALAYDVLYKKEGNSVKLPKFIPPATNDYTRRFLKSLYTEEFVNTAAFRSAFLSSPFNSICALFVEFGIVGTFIYMFFNCKITVVLLKKNSIISITAFFLLVSNFVLAFFEPSFEYSVRYLIFVYITFALMTTDNKNKKELKCL
jgi:hypothetical protein